MSPLLYPQFSVLDPTLTFTLPPRQIANGVADAFVHIVEQYLTHPQGGMVQDHRYAEGPAADPPRDRPQGAGHAKKKLRCARNLMWVATQALNGLIGPACRRTGPPT